MTQWTYTKEIRIDFDNFILDKDNHHLEMRNAYWDLYIKSYKELVDKGEAFPGFEIFPVALAFRNIVGDLINISESSTITTFTRISIFILTHTFSQANLVKDSTVESYIKDTKDIILERADITNVNITIDPTLTHPLKGLPFIGEQWDKYNDYNYPLSGFGY
jgi:hypothetical protein